MHLRSHPELPTNKDGKFFSWSSRRHDPTAKHQNDFLVMENTERFDAEYKSPVLSTVPTLSHEYEYGATVPVHHAEILFRNPWLVNIPQSTMWEIDQHDEFLPWQATPTATGVFSDAGPWNGGAFLNAGTPARLKQPYYSISNPRHLDGVTMQPKTLPLATGDWFLFEWFKDYQTDLVPDPLTGVTADPPDPALFDTKAVIFHNPVGWATGRYKAHLMSSTLFSMYESRCATCPNSQRKIDWTESQNGFPSLPDGLYQSTYESGGSVWYTHSSDMGNTWSKELVIRAGEKPAIASGDTDARIALAADGGVTFFKVSDGSQPEFLNEVWPYASDDAAPSIAYDDAQNVMFSAWERSDGMIGCYVDWEDGGNMVSYVLGSGGSGFDAMRPTIAHSPGSDEYHLAWREGTNIWYATATITPLPAGTFQITSPELVSDPAQSAYGAPSMTVDNQGLASVAWSSVYPSLPQYGAYIAFRQRTSAGWGTQASLLSYPALAYWLPSISAYDDMSADAQMRIAHNVDNGMIGVLKFSGLGWQIPADIQGQTLSEMHPNLVDYAPGPYQKQVASKPSQRYAGIPGELAFAEEHLSKTTKSTTLSSAREVVLLQDTSRIAVRAGEFYVRTGSVDTPIDWGSGFDTLIVGKTKSVAEYLKTTPFVVPSNSHLRFRVVTGRSGNLQTTNPLHYTVELVDSATNQVLASPHTIAPNALNVGRVDAQYNSSLNSLAGMKVYARMNLTAVDTTIRIRAIDYYHDPAVAIPKGSDAAAGESALPGRVVLGRNYPNPFNPMTEIPFTLTEPMSVRLVVLDAFGREIAVLKDGPCGAGYNVASFDGTDRPSGVYFYRIETHDGTRSGRMMLMK